MRDFVKVGEFNRGDFNNDGRVNAPDVDLLFDAISSGSTNPIYDLDGSGTVTDGDSTYGDVDELILIVLNTYYGDANLDGAFDSSDFVQVMSSGEYEDSINDNSTWSEGDWNGDDDFTSSDFTLASLYGGYEQPNRGGGAFDVHALRFGFTGRIYDGFTGLQNNLNRWYDADVGRWLSEDPIGFAAGDANLYRYVANKPTNLRDPSGLHFIDEDGDGKPDAPPPPHGGELRERSMWTYSKHYSILLLPAHVNRTAVKDYVFGLLKTFAQFDNKYATVTLNNDGTVAQFDLQGLQGDASDFINDARVFVHLKQTGKHELTATTAGKHQLIGIRKWRIRDAGNIRGCAAFIIETEADERARGKNGLTELPVLDYLSGARDAQINLWKIYIERNAADASVRYHGDYLGPFVFGPFRSGPRFNKFRPPLDAKIGAR